MPEILAQAQQEVTVVNERKKEHGPWSYTDIMGTLLEDVERYREAPSNEMALLIFMACQHLVFIVKRDPPGERPLRIHPAIDPNNLGNMKRVLDQYAFLKRDLDRYRADKNKGAAPGAAGP